MKKIRLTFCTCLARTNNAFLFMIQRMHVDVCLRCTNRYNEFDNGVRQIRGRPWMMNVCKPVRGNTSNSMSKRTRDAITIYKVSVTQHENSTGKNLRAFLLWYTLYNKLIRFQAVRWRTMTIDPFKIEFLLGYKKVLFCPL